MRKMSTTTHEMVGALSERFAAGSRAETGVLSRLPVRRRCECGTGG